MSWNIVLKPEAQEDFDALDGSQKDFVVKGLNKAKRNPLPKQEGGFGETLGNKNGLDLTGCLKIKLKKPGIRIIYQLEKTAENMNVIVIGMRAESAVYKEAARRLGR